MLKYLHSINQLTPLEFLDKSFNFHANNISFYDKGYSYTFSETYTRIKNLSYFFIKNGLMKGEKVAILSMNCMEVIELHFAIAKAGGVVVTINPNLSISEIIQQLEFSEAKFLFLNLPEDKFSSIVNVGNEIFFIALYSFENKIDKLKENNFFIYESCLKTNDTYTDEVFPVINEYDDLAINFTSGTTGFPKAVVYTHRTAYLQALGQIIIFNLDIKTVYFWSLPMFHGNGWAHIWALFAISATQIIYDNNFLNDITDVLNKIRFFNVTHLAGSPRLLKLLAFHNDSYSLNSLNLMIGGASPSPELLKKFYELKINLVNQYGLNESLGSITSTSSKFHDFKSEDDYVNFHSKQGIVSPHFGSKFKLINDKGELAEYNGKEIGEILIRGNTLFSRYYKNNEMTDKSIESNWFRTGDLAVIHSDGSLQLKDRKKDLIFIENDNDWLNVSSLEIEYTLLKYKYIDDVAVVGINSQLAKGTEIIAFIESSMSLENFNDDLLLFCSQNLGELKTPKKFILTELPKTATGKIKKHELLTSMADIDDL
ncbi:AMP-binding protein [Acinetobacter baumannii]|nr:AMP-binding protein [Acinetobacter baumannii]